MLKVSAQTIPDSLVYVKTQTPSSDEDEANEQQHKPSPPHIDIGTDSMQVVTKHISIYDKENPFTGFGENIVGNIKIIINYSNSNDEEEEERKMEEEEKKMKEEEEKKKKEEEKENRKEIERIAKEKRLEKEKRTVEEERQKAELVIVAPVPLATQIT